MLIGMKNDITNVFSLMEHSQFDFYLTGSRYFGTQRPDSDWDFYTKFSAECHQWLAGNDFTIDQMGYAGDPECMMVMRHNSHPIHIQLVRNNKLKTAAQQAIRNTRALLEVDKDKAIWRLAYYLL